MLGIISRIKRRDKKIIHWLDNIESVTRLNIQQLKEVVLYGVVWRAVAMVKTSTIINIVYREDTQ